MFIFQTTQAAWYGNHGVSFNGGSPKAKYCDVDGDTTGGSHPTYGERAAADNNSSTTTNPETGIHSIASSGTVRCLYWDGANPDSVSVTYTAGWTNTAKTITLQWRDLGGSRLKKLELYERVNGGSYTKVTQWDSLNATSTVTRTWSRSASNGNSYNYRVIAYDYAGNTTTITNSSTIQFDTVNPNAPSINSITHVNGTPSANRSPSFTLSKNSAGPSPSTNYYCLEQGGNTCDPNIAGDSASYSNLAEGSWYFRSKTCDTGGCSTTASFALLFDDTAPLAPTITSSTHIDGELTTNNDPSFTLAMNGQGPSPSTNYYCLEQGGNTCDPNIAGNSVSYTDLADGSWNFRAKTCDTGGCGPTVSFAMTFDTSTPTNLTVTYNTGWRNSDQTITVTGEATGASQLKRLELHERLAGGSYAKITEWDNINSSVLETRTWTKTATDGQTVNYRVVAINDLDLSSNVDNTDTIAFDITPPTAADVFNESPVNGLEIGTETFNTSFQINVNGGSPITGFTGKTTDSIGTTSNINESGDSYVRTDISTSGLSYYIIEVTGATDEAGNTAVFAPKKTIYYPIDTSAIVGEEALATVTDKQFEAYVIGNYNNNFLISSTGGVDYIYSVPSLITTLNQDTTLQNVSDNKAFVFDGYWNLPHTYQTGTGGFNYSADNFLIYSKVSDESFSDLDIELISNKIKEHYKKSVFKNSSKFSDITGSEWDTILKQKLIGELERKGLKYEKVATSATWRNLDTNCEFNDVVVGTQVWAGCNSTLGTGVETFTSSECYNFAGASIPCTNLEGDQTESDLVAGQTDYIWGKLYLGTQMDSACPSGWRVPTEQDWIDLEENLGCTDTSIDGWRCVWYGWNRWILSYANLVNSMKLPLSGQATGSNLEYRGYNGHYWTSTVNSGNLSENYVRKVSTEIPLIYRWSENRNLYNSVRCIKE